MAQDGMEKSERTIQDVLKEINDNLELIIKTQKEMTQTLDNYIEHKEKIIEEHKKSIKKELEEEQESCISCAYWNGWNCSVAGDRVKRDGHCSEYESEIAKKKC